MLVTPLRVIYGALEFFRGTVFLVPASGRFPLHIWQEVDFKLFPLGGGTARRGFRELPMGLRTSGIFALFFTLSGAPVVAGHSFHCGIEPLSGDAWIPGQVSLQFTDDFKAAEVTDKAFEVPVRARVVRHSSTSYALNWTMPHLAVSEEAGRPQPLYRAVLNTANLKMSLQVVRAGQSGSPPRGSGQCKWEHDLPLLAQNAG